MFKRVEKRRRKKEEEEDLGLDDDMKEVLGMNDTDSDESDSDNSDSASEGEEEGESLVFEMEGEDGEDEEDEDIRDEEEGVENEGEDEEESDEEEDPAISIQEALRDPVYLISIQPDVKACIVCPGKLLKGRDMTDLHRNSNSHKRRLKQFTKLAADAEPKESAWELLKRGSEEKPKQSLTPSATSKRAEKKQKTREIRKARRAKANAKAKAKKEKEAVAASADTITKSTGNLDSASIKSAKPRANSKPTKSVSFDFKPSAPPTKKRKVEAPKSSADSTPLPAKVKPSPTKATEGTTTKTAVTNIAKTASDRAKKARSRVMSASRKKVAA
ncbi:hypothetical protein BDQ12DRAFT_715951 [Crucibulum laeve]|uniref:Uncharacterized protein n=1 Tax=Crucibulum laeve TaxID=68775 RepID=A0A5C3LML8_9AGAR|nr:hypothetical protein BDQ12DRAFT_715951 [Crucibulum laeve]